ncbi:MAG TPA: response regulator [Nitrososphaeraceae archaeon]|jgi:DNA-binding response OmpR family regulator|nr:response regulator [Nitrososphaeraceae archaeon]
MNEDMIIETRSRKRILVVDDESDITLALKTVLDGDQFQVDSFNDPISARNNFKPGLYDLLILDIKMPIMNGFQLYREIKNMDDKVKVCFLTALNEMHDYQEYKKEVSPKPGERFFIQKPVENQTLLRRVYEITN